MSKVEVSCCMIVKNEEVRIKGCLSSIVSEVDEIILVDTGSTDKTLEIASTFDPKVRIFHFDWKDDFAAARNASLSEARGDWVIFIDADERFNPLGRRDILRLIAREGKADAYFVGIRSFRMENDEISASFDWAVRFFRRFPDIEFSGMIHESVEPYLLRRGAIIKRAPFIIDHFGYSLKDDKWQSKIERNFRIALKQIRKDPKDIYTLYHLALTAYLLGKVNTASRLLNRACQLINISEDRSKLQLSCFILNLRSKLFLDQKAYDEAIEVANRSLTLIPQQKSARLIKGLALMSQQKWDEAIPWLEEALKFTLHETDPFSNLSMLSMEFSISISELKRTLAGCYARIGHHEKALSILNDNVDSHYLLILAAASLENQDLKGVFFYLRSISLRVNQLPLQNMLSLFHHSISLMTDPSSIETDSLKDFLKILAARRDWKDVLIPFLDLLISQEKDAWLLRETMVSDIMQARLEIILSIRKEDPESIIKRGSILFKKLLSRKDLSEEEIDTIKLYMGLLFQRGKKQEALFIKRRLENIRHNL
ncbi:MAG: glycosyltransferase [Deltaproteobacteria bacterium]|nr:glycosyltransferase [Deltaproteobacteria bacterium]